MKKILCRTAILFSLSFFVCSCADPETAAPTSDFPWDYPDEATVENLEVLARVEAQLRRVQKFSAPPERRQFVCGDLVLDREEFSVTAGGEPVVLTAREFEILALLMEYPKRVFTREQIYQHVWGEEYFGDDNTVNVHISNLRAKLGRVSDREYIKTVWGIGFKMAEP